MNPNNRRPGHIANPTGSSSEAGWRERRANAAAVAAEASDFYSAERVRVREERARLEEIRQLESQREAARQAVTLAETPCYCPACGGEGKVTARRAEEVMRVFEHRPDWSVPRVVAVEALARVARGERAVVGLPHRAHGLAEPRAVEGQASVEGTELRPEPADITPVEKVLTKPKRKPEPELAYTPDGALIDLDD